MTDTNTEIIAQRVEAALHALRSQDVDADGIRAAMDAFTERHGLPAIRFDAHGAAALSVKGLSIVLTQTPNYPGLVASAFFDLEEEDSDRLAPFLLRQNMNWAETGGAIFTRLPPAREVQLSQQIVIRAGDGAGFEDDLMSFVRIALRWRTTLSELSELPDTGLDDI